MSAASWDGPVSFHEPYRRAVSCVIHDSLACGAGRYRCRAEAAGLSCNARGLCGIELVGMDAVRTTDREIYEQIAPALTRFATALVGPDAAADVVSTVIVRVLSKRSLVSLERPEPYLMQAVVNEARARARGRRRRTLALVRVGPGPSARDTAEIAPSELTESVMALPEQQRAAIYLVYWCDFTPSEAAETLGCKPATLRRYLHLARNKLARFSDE